MPKGEERRRCSRKSSHSLILRDMVGCFFLVFHILLCVLFTNRKLSKYWEVVLFFGLVTSDHYWPAYYIVTLRDSGFLPNLIFSPKCFDILLSCLNNYIHCILIFSFFPQCNYFPDHLHTSLDLETDYYNYNSKPIFCCPALSWVIECKWLFPLHALPSC